jgi:hypothetical protein
MKLKELSILDLIKQMVLFINTKLSFYRQFSADMGHDLRQEAAQGRDDHRSFSDCHWVHPDGAPSLFANQEVHSSHGCRTAFSR